MVLSALGDECPELMLAKVMGSYDFGTPARRVTRLEKLNYQIKFGQFSLEELQAYLGQGLFPIVFVYAGFLPWADFEGFHALVLTRVTPSDVLLLDPALDDGPTRLSINGFLLAWEEFDSLAAVISFK